jgi:hypothetical protein
MQDRVFHHSHRKVSGKALAAGGAANATHNQPSPNHARRKKSKKH